jgi:aminopeptidase-like protein
LGNDNLSGISVAVELAKYLKSIDLRYSYRFLFIPGTIGSIAWLSKNEHHVKKIKHGLVITLLGDSSSFNYKKSRIGNSEIDVIVEYCLMKSKKEYKIKEFIPYGYDERQFCSSGFNLPVGCLTRRPYGEFHEYHSSADNLDFINENNLQESLLHLKEIVKVVEGNKKFLNLSPKCEPQLGKRGLYQKIGGTSESKTIQLALLWVLNYSDGQNSLVEIAIKSGIDFSTIQKAAQALLDCKLIETV